MSSKIPVAISFSGIANLLGVLGVIGSLVFVGLELQQSQRIAQAQQQQERIAAFLNLIGSNNEAGVDWQSTVYEADSEASEQLSQAEIVRRNNYHAHLFNYENDYFQYTQSLMTDAVWDAKLQALSFFYNQCDMRVLLDFRMRWFPSGFNEIIKTLPNSCSDD